MLSPDLIAILRCPETRQPLHLASAAEMARLPVGFEGALVREDGLRAYPIREGFPILLITEALPLAGAPS
jgi:uncharacterized protein YbaR (Trm112 family)